MKRFSMMLDKNFVCMLKRVCWTLLFFILVQASSFANENSTGSGDCTITLLVKNPERKEIIVDITPISLVSRPATRDQKKILLDDKNRGILKTTLKGPSLLKFMNIWSDSTISYVAMPGFDLVIHFDGLRKDTTEYNDIGPKENDFYADIITKSIDRLKAFPQNDPELFLKKWEQEQNAMLELVAAATASGMSTIYTLWISQSIESLFQSKLCRQFVTYVTITRQWPSNTEEYIKKVKPLTLDQFNQPDFFTKETDKELVESYYMFYSLIQDRKKHLPAPNAETNYRNAINYSNKITAESSRNLMLRYLLSTAIANTTDTTFLKWMKNTIVFDKQTEYLGKMVTEKQSLLQKIGKGTTAPHFNATDFTGNTFSYKNYEGKYLFIDIWATWCVPCRKEIPYMEQLKQKYAGQPIEFISVSTDKNFNAWKKFVESDSKGQFHSMQGQTSSINEVYKADLIPAFVLIDPQGKIVNPNIFRPSDPALELLLDELLQKNMKSVQ